jgi:hypothetical protein
MPSCTQALAGDGHGVATTDNGPIYVERLLSTYGSKVRPVLPTTSGTDLRGYGNWDPGGSLMVSPNQASPKGTCSWLTMAMAV